MSNLDHIYVKILPERKKNSFLQDKLGAVAIEFSIIMPLLVVFTFAIIEFGNYYIKELAAQRAVSTVASYIQNVYPNATMADAQKINNDLSLMVGNLGSGLIPQENLQDPSEFCGKAFATDTQAKSYVVCTIGAGFKVGRYDADPSGTFVNSKTKYSVSIVASFPYFPITGIESIAGFKMPHEIVSRAVITMAATTPSLPSASCTETQYITYDSTNNSFVCNAFPPSALIPSDCTQNGRVLKFYGGEFHCETVGSNPHSIDCGDSRVNGLKWDGTKYQCVDTQEEDEDCSSYSSNDKNVNRFVKYDSASKSFKCHCKKHNQNEEEDNHEGDDDSHH